MKEKRMHKMWSWTKTEKNEAIKEVEREKTVMRKNAKERAEG